MADKGNYYKRRTRDWLVSLGYQVEFIEKLQRITKKDGRVFSIKRDLFHSDLLAVGNNQIIFANSILTKHNLADHIKNYATIPWPVCEHIKVWIIVWERGWRAPEVIDMAEVEVEN